MYSKEEEEEEEYEKVFLIKKGNEFNACETQLKHTRAANTNKERGNQLTKMSPNNKYDGTRIPGHEQGDPPKTEFPYSLAHPDNRQQRNKGAINE